MLNKVILLKKMLVLMVVMLICLSYPSIPVHADELSDLKDQMLVLQKQMQNQMKEHTRQMTSMQSKIEALENRSTSNPYGPKHVVSREVLEKFELGGEVEVEFVNTQSDALTGEPKPHMQLDRFRLEPEIQITEDIRLESDIDIDEDGADIVEIYFQFENLPWNSTLQIGLDEKFYNAKHYTEHYPLNANAFWRDEIWQFLLEMKHDPFYVAFSWSQAAELDMRGTGEDSSTGNAYSLIHDDKRKSSFDGLQSFAVGLGVVSDLGDWGEMDLLAFGEFSDISTDDVAFLQTRLNNYSSNDDQQYRIGGNIDYSVCQFNLVGQIIDAKDGDLNRLGWFVQPSYLLELPVEWRYMQNHRLLARYGQLRVYADKTFSKPGTWDREEVTLALISDVTKNFKLKTEYSFQLEETGHQSIDDNEFLMQLEYKF